MDAQPSGNAPLVLVVEDEQGIAEILSAYLQRDGLLTRTVADGNDALDSFHRFRPDLVLIDIHLPGMDGMELLRRIRSETSTPVIMVTALAEDLDKLVALRMGADDYVVKPFNPAEVVARVRAVLRRSQSSTSSSGTAPVRIGALEIDMESHVAFVHDKRRGAAPQPLMLTLTEFRILSCMATRPRRCYSRANLIEHCLPDSDALERVIDSHLSKLRRKLQLAGLDNLIVTVRGIGYRLCPDD